MAQLLPEGAWDCHFHVYGPWRSYPLPADSSYHPAEAPFSTISELHRQMGITRGVLVQSVPYGTDHAAILGAILQNPAYRGIALVKEDITDSELQLLHNGGIRGVRLNMMGHLPMDFSLSSFYRLAERIAPLGWHVLIHGHLDTILPAIRQWQNFPVPIIIDHMGRINFKDKSHIRELELLVELLVNDNIWLKLSGIDRAMQGESPPWDVAVKRVRRLLHAAPERTLWGTDWPHPNIKGDIPDDRKLVDFIIEVCDRKEMLHQILVDNPEKLYF